MQDISELHQERRLLKRQAGHRSVARGYRHSSPVVWQVRHPVVHCPHRVGDGHVPRKEEHGE